MKRASELLTKNSRRDIEELEKNVRQIGDCRFYDSWRYREKHRNSLYSVFGTDFYFLEKYPNEVRVSPKALELKNSKIIIHGWSTNDKQGQKDFNEWVLMDNNIIIGKNYDDRTLDDDTRISNEEYWPSEEFVMKQRDEWTNKLLNGLKEFHTEYPEFSDFKDCYTDANRRYGTKNNPINRLAYLTGIDPQGRFRWFYEYMPKYILEELFLADENVGRELGLTEEELENLEEYRSLG